MNALNYINGLTGDYLRNTPASAAFEAFSTQYPNVASYPYFRTAFNHAKRIANETSGHTPVYTETIDTEVIVQAKIEVEEELAVRSVKNYQKGDKLPEVPTLIPTGTFFDQFISDRITTEEEKKDYLEHVGEEMPLEQIEIGGFTRKCIDIVAGPAGSGKTYSRCILAAKAKIFARTEYGIDIRVGFISGEMRSSEWGKELAKCELLRELEVDYMLDHVGFPNYEDIFWEAFGDYDIVIVDSLPAIMSHFKMSTPPNQKTKTESQMIFDFIRKALQSVDKNNNNVQLINQANKDGNYKGGTELPHMMSSMSFVRIEGQQRYMEFEKNRNNGKVGRKLYFTKLKNGDIQFNTETYDATYNQKEDAKRSVNDLLNSLNRSEMDSLGEGSDLELSPTEMGTGGNTQDELQELAAVVAH